MTYSEDLIDRYSDSGLPWDYVIQICEDHGIDAGDFLADELDGVKPEMTDPETLLTWLGY